MTTMKSSFFIVCLVATILLSALAAPVAAAPSISTISPSHAYNGARVTGVIISGSGFNVTTGSVRLKMSGENSGYPAIGKRSGVGGRSLCVLPSSQ